MTQPDYDAQVPADPSTELVTPPSASPDILDSPGDLPLSPDSDLRAPVLQQRARQRSRKRAHRRIAGILRRRRMRPRTALKALVAEDNNIGSARDLVQATHAETVVYAAGKAGAENVLDRAQRRLQKEADEIDKLHAKRAQLLANADHRSGDHVRHPDGGRRLVRDVQREEAAHRAQINQDRARGSLKHHGMPRWLGRVPLVILVADFCLLLYFFSGITNVDWSAPLSGPLVFALVLALLVTAAFFASLSFAGYRLRVFKDHSGAVALADVDGLTKLACVSVLVGIVVIAALMFVRMRTEVLDALGSQAWVTALIIALVLAVVSVMANFLVVVIHALDGSDEMSRLHALSTAASGPMVRAHRTREEAAALLPAIAARRRRAYRLAAHAISRAGQQLSSADQVIGAARSVHQGTRPHSGPVSDPNLHDGVVGYLDHDSAPKTDGRPLRTTLEHIDSDLPSTDTWHREPQEPESS